MQVHNELSDSDSSDEDVDEDDFDCFEDDENDDQDIDIDDQDIESFEWENIFIGFWQSAEWQINYQIVLNNQFLITANVPWSCANYFKAHENENDNMQWINKM